jgi:AraC-like DNA-binding protein
MIRQKNQKYSILAGRKKHGFFYVLNGSLQATFKNNTVSQIIATKGDLIFVPKGAIYTGLYLEDDTRIKMIQFDLFSGTLPEYLSTPSKIDLPRAHEIVDSLFKPIENRMTPHPFYYLSKMYELLQTIDETYAKIPQKYKKLSPAISEITECPNENRTVAYYANLCDMSESNFRRLFKDYIGFSPVDYRNEMRLINARNKLQSGEYNVSEAAYECGFSNLSFFIRLYKKKYGHTPKNE